MSICDSEENRKKLAWLVPGYILLAWFFCVLFQPLGLAPPPPSSSSVGVLRDALYYEIIDLLPEKDVPRPEVCGKNGSTIVLEAGRRSAILIRLREETRENQDPYSPFNCSLTIKAGKSLDGISAVVEKLDLREHEDDVRSPGGHWGSSVCIDYVRVYSPNSSTGQNDQLCGRWNVRPDERFASEGKRRKLIGYCYDVHKGHSCETKILNVDLALDPNKELSRRYSLKSPRSISIVITGYRHPDENVTGGKAVVGQICKSHQEIPCYAIDGSIHGSRPHCIWKNLGCDGHPNCGFHVNYDEQFCSYPPLPTQWSISTMTILMAIWLFIVSALVCITLLLLKWHKGVGSGTENDEETTAAAAEVVNRAAAAGTVSIMVMYRPANTSTPHNAPKGDAPPTYDSLFMDESPPPNYNETTIVGAEES